MSNIPTKPGWYWARYKTPTDDTSEEDGLTRGDDWEIVCVMKDIPKRKGEERLSVLVCGTEKEIEVGYFFWGPMIAEYGAKP